MIHAKVSYKVGYSLVLGLFQALLSLLANPLVSYSAVAVISAILVNEKWHHPVCHEPKTAWPDDPNRLDENTYTKPAAETMSPVNQTSTAEDNDEDSSEVDWATGYESQFTAQHGQSRPVVWVDGVDVSHLSDVSQNHSRKYLVLL